MLHDCYIFPKLLAPLQREVARLEQLLQVVGCVEVFAELTARRLGGTPLRWLLVLLLTSLKLSIRLCLIYRHRRVLISTNGLGDDAPKGWVGPRSGVFFKRSIPESDLSHIATGEQEVLGELCHTLRPAAHLAASALCKRGSWIPVLASLALDCYSYRNLRMVAHPTERQEGELARRKTLFLLYLLRGPLYSEVTGQHITRLVKFIDSIPVLNLLSDGILEYLPKWRDIYFYLWNS